jgi:hypothetical protein
MDAALKAFQSHLKEYPLRTAPFPFDLEDEETVCADLDDLSREQLVFLKREASEYIRSLPHKLLEKYESLYFQNGAKEHMFLDLYQQIQKNLLGWTFMLEYAQNALTDVSAQGIPDGYSFHT